MSGDEEIRIGHHVKVQNPKDLTTEDVRQLTGFDESVEKLDKGLNQIRTGEDEKKLTNSTIDKALENK